MAGTQQHGDLGMLGKSACLLVVGCRSLPCFGGGACTDMIQASGVPIGFQACIPVPTNLSGKCFTVSFTKVEGVLTVTTSN